MSEKVNKLLKILFIFYLMGIVALCLWHFKDMSGLNGTILGIPKDKITHFVMFFPFSFLLFWAYDDRTETPAKSLLWLSLTVIIGLLFAAGTEIAQELLTQYRSADPKDFLADGLSIGISALIVFCIDIGKQRHKARKEKAK